MIVRQADAELLPSYNTYVFGEKIFRPLVNAIGGYTVYNAEVLRPLDGKSYIPAANHRSNWDSILLGLAMLDLPQLTQDSDEGPLQPRALRYMAKDTLWRWPVVKQFVERCGAFPVKRGRGVGLESHQVDHITNLADNDAVIPIYPQGHRVRDSKNEESLDFNEFKSTVAHLHLEYGIPLVPVGIYGPVGIGRKLPRELMFDEPIFSEKMDPQDPAFKLAKRALMKHLHARVNGTYQQVRQLYLDKHPTAGN